MILNCKVQCNYVEDLEGEEALAELGLPQKSADELDCLWREESLDLSHFFRTHIYNIKKDTNDSCSEADGYAILYFLNGDSVIINIPFKMFLPAWYAKNTEGALEWTGKSYNIIFTEVEGE